MDDLGGIARLDEMDQDAREVLADMRAAFADVPPEEIDRQTDRIMAEIRPEDRAKREQIVPASK